MCCCPCLNPLAMLIPMVVATLLRFILWISLFNILSQFITAADSEAGDNLFWMVVSLATFDSAPMVLLCIDWYVYYNRGDFEGIFGYKHQPLRVAFAQAIPLFILSWSFILAVAELFTDPDQASQFTWPWILHGLVSTAVIGITLAGHYGKFIQGNSDRTGWYKYVCWIGGLAILVMWLIIAIQMLKLLNALLSVGDDDTFDSDTDSGAQTTTQAAQTGGTIVWLAFMLYYSALTIPGAVGLFMVKSNPHFTNEQ
eukprot:CAMPEP_0197046648 /NCGR_PEP_ID=MMETSP1384-20130603/22338_1 /TAXON_ID=29189 /ORGANISM="Ammonia sp." /LENGTH=254 /DNA_ID=CAMNT_0042478481 /DNA_START=291 /DNA_END=1055 /DNA_ORIENTATION=+